MKLFGCQRERKLYTFSIISILLLGFAAVIITTRNHVNRNQDSTSHSPEQIPFNWDNYTSIIAALDSNIISQWRANLSTNKSDILVDKLNEIRELSPFGRDLNESWSFSDGPSEICYTEECLDAALTLLKVVNFSVDPCNDFYEFSCGRWEINNPNPEREEGWSALKALATKSINVNRRILQAPVDNLDWEPIKQAKEFYSSCLDRATIEKKGVAPILTILDSYGGWPSVTPDWNPASFNVNTAIADGFRVFAKSIILSPGVGVAEYNGTSEHRIYLNKPTTFFLADEPLLNPKKYPLRLDSYKTYYVGVAKVLANATGAYYVTDEDLASQVEDVIEFETRLLRSNESPNESINANKTRSIQWQYAGLKLNLKTIIYQLFSTSGVSVRTDEKIFSIDKPYISNLTSILASTHIRTVANYFCWRLAALFVPYTTQVLNDLQNEFYKVNFGLLKPEMRDTSCVYSTLSQFSMPIGSKYVENVLSPNTKSSAEEIVENIRASFQQQLMTASWMEEETRTEAIKKLKVMTEFIGYPDWIFNQTRLEQEYEGLVLVPRDFFGSRLNFLRWSANKTLNSIRSNPDVNETKWEHPLSTANAFYNRIRNSIRIYAGVLQPPFYRQNALKSLNYGGVGAGIGHEISHGFDIGGHRYDSNGQITNWWTNTTWDQFFGKAYCFIKQYSGLRTEQGPVNGTLTSDENISDNVGLRQAFFAYRKWVQDRNGGKQEPRLPGLELYSPEQIFFLGYANNWCESITTQNRGSTQSELDDDPHTAGRFRVMIPLQNFDEFGLQWRCRAGSPMTPAVDKTCKLWR